MQDSFRTRPRIGAFCATLSRSESTLSPTGAASGYLQVDKQLTDRLNEMRTQFPAVEAESQKLISVSNRLPSTAIYEESSDEWKLKKSSGGLSSALSAVENLHMMQVGWPGADVPDSKREAVTRELRDHSCTPVYLSHDEIELYYNGFSNGVLWPLFHYVTPALIAGSSEAEWNAYVRVNKEFARIVAELLQGHASDTLVWIHDYHLLLVPQYLRERVPEANIGFFLHTPFPCPELFRMLPYREEILRGLLSANHIGFQVKDYCRHFLSACSQLTNLTVIGDTVDAVPVGGALVYCGTIPIGIDPKPFADAARSDPQVVSRIAELDSQIGPDTKIILGVDRLDYMKGIQHKLQAYGKLLDLHPEWVGKVVLVQLAVPSRSEVKEYQRLRKHVHELVGELCGKHSHLSTGPPVLYLDQAIDFSGLVALYKRADVMLITSIRDGMNLVAFEYSACQEDSFGVLVISEFAGAMQSMGGGALRVNPWNIEETSRVIHRALTMGNSERRSRHQYCFEYVSKHTAQRWAATCLDSLKSAVTDSEALRASIPTLLPEAEVCEAWATCGPPEGSRVLVLGLVDCLMSTLVATTREPVVLFPDKAVLPGDVRFALERLLFSEKIGEGANVVIVIVTPHKREILDCAFAWIGDRRCALVLVAENGCVMRTFDQPARVSTNEWVSVLVEAGYVGGEFKVPEWRSSLRKLVEFLQERTPGSFIEESDLSLKWFTQNTENMDSATLRELLAQRWAGPLSGSDEAEVVLADRYVEVRAKSASLAANIGRVISHPEVSNLFQQVAFCMTIGSFPYKDDDLYQAVDDAFAPKQPRQTVVSADMGSMSEESRIAEEEKLFIEESSMNDALELPRISSTPSLRSSYNGGCRCYSVTVSHARISKAKFAVPTRHHVSHLLQSLADLATTNRPRGG